MSDTLDRSFKYAMQDTNRIYIGGRMTYQEMITWDEVPFKIKAIVNKHFIPDAKDTECTFAKHFETLSKDSFLFQICKTLKMKVKVDIPYTAQTKSGETVRFKSEVMNIGDYLDYIRGEHPEGLVTEEISFSKLAVLVFAG